MGYLIFDLDWQLYTSPGVGPYYVRLYDGTYDASGFDTEEEARQELEYLIQ